MAAQLRADWQVKSLLQQTKETYNFLLQYALDGVDDPHRTEMLAEISLNIINAVDNMIRRHESISNPSLYFSTLRTLESDVSKSINSVFEDYDKLKAKLNAASFTINKEDGQSSIQLKKETERAEQEIFNAIWTKHPLSADDIKTISKRLENSTDNPSLSRLIIGALMLGGIQCRDENRALLLANLYKESSQPIDIMALVALLLLLVEWKDTPLSRKTQLQIEALSDIDGFDSDIRLCFTQFLRARDSARIARKLDEEFIPTMMKLRPEIEKLRDMQELADISEPGENPEWEEMLHNSGIEDQLKQLNDMRLEGADVMMGTFSHLKHFTFFNNVANWFRQFDASISDISDIVADNTMLAEIVNHAIGLCDSDKYSLIFALNSAPHDAREMLISQLQGQDIDFSELAAQNSQPEARDEVANAFVQDLNRFYKFFRRKNEFKNPLLLAVNLLDIPIIAQHIQSASVLSLAAEFYLKRGYYDDALQAFTLLDGIDNTVSASLYQKMGYCYEHTGDINNAINYYERADLIDGRNTWTLRRLATSYKNGGRPKQALETFNRLAELSKPDDSDLTLNIAHCMMETGDYKGAINNYYKVEYLNPGTTSTHRAMAWCSFLAGDYQRSAEYYQKILGNKPTSTDYLNRGHLALAMHEYRNAVAFYTQALQLGKWNIETLREKITADKKVLEEISVNQEYINLILDKINFDLLQ